MRGVVAIVVGAVALGACNGKNLDLGGGDAGAPTDSSGTEGGGPGGEAQTWKGYFEAYQLPSGSDAITVRLSLANNGTIAGTVFMGDGPPRAPPTDPNVGYPPPGPGYNEIENFAFTILHGTLETDRVLLSLDGRELYKQWCELQTMTFPFDGGSSCIPDDIYGPCPPGFNTRCCSYARGEPGGVDASPVGVDCQKQGECAVGVCDCDTTSCTVHLGSRPWNIAPRFDMHLVGDHLDGSVLGLSGGSGAVNVHLTRQP